MTFWFDMLDVSILNILSSGNGHYSTNQLMGKFSPAVFNKGDINCSAGETPGIAGKPLACIHVCIYIYIYIYQLSPCLPFLCWWHTALSLISTRWSNGSCTDLRLPGGHLGLDERKPSTAQPGKDWASCLPCNSNSTAWFHDSVRFINNYPISFSQKSWCNLRWPAVLQRAHCKDCSILQVCTSQHQKDQFLSDRACSTTSCPGPCHF